MNRKETELALLSICKTFAKVHELNIVTMKDSKNGLWDNTDFTGLHTTLGEYFTQKYGKKLEEIHFTSVPFEDYDLRKDFKISFKYRFGNPKICVGTQWGEDGYACVEFGGDDNDQNYRMVDAQIFKESGIKYFRTIMDCWHMKRKEAGEDPLDYKLKEGVRE